MKQRWYKIELLAPLVFTARNVTEGDYTCLDYIPGQSLLGAVAAKTYAALEESGDAWTAFHRGAVRFHDALLLGDGEVPAFPVAFSLHTVKREDAGRLFNHALEFASGNKQYEQVRSGHLEIDSETGNVVRRKVDKVSSLKIAVNWETGSARDGHLYGMEAIAQGQVFLASVGADLGVSEGLLDRLEAGLVGECRLGRSRNAEFGRVRISRVDEGFEKTWAQLAGTADIGTEAVVYLLGDLALDDAHGNQRLEVRASDFGLPDDVVDGWTLDLERSFIRYRFFDRFNGYRKGFDLQREVLERGSVLVFKGPKMLDDAQKKRALEFAGRGAGLNRNEGLGRYLLNPAWLRDEELVLVKAGADDVAPAVRAPDAELVAFLKRRRPALEQAEHRALHLIARQLAEFCASDRNAPGESQWSRVRQWAKTAPLSRESFLSLVGGTQEKMSRGWEIVYDRDGTLGDFLSVRAAENVAGEAQKRVYLSELAHLVRGHLVHIQKTKEVASW